MNIVPALLIKKISDDGLFEAHDEIEIGTEYFVDIDSIRVQKGFNILKMEYWFKEIVNIVEPDGLHLGWFPTELLNILDY